MFMRTLWMHDLSPRADAVEGPLSYLAARSDAEVLVGHALGAALEPDAGPADPALVERRAEAEAYLRPVVARLVDSGVPTTLVIRSGQPVEVAEALIEAHNIGLVVCGATGAHGLDRAILGSTAGKLTRNLNCSVLVVRSPLPRLARLLCAVDTARVSEAAILHAAALARRTGARLEFMTVVEPVLDLTDTGSAVERLNEALIATLGQDRDPSWTAVAMTGETPTQGILHRASTVDLVVMGTQGRKGWRRLLLGSVAETVVQSCPVSVLVAR